MVLKISLYFQSFITLFQSSVSHDSSEIILIFWFAVEYWKKICTA